MEIPQLFLSKNFALTLPHFLKQRSYLFVLSDVVHCQWLHLKFPMNDYMNHLLTLSHMEVSQTWRMEGLTINPHF